MARRHAHPQSVGAIDETSFVKKGDKTACVQRQHCGAVGKTENCVVSVPLGYATPEFYSLIDGEVYLPEGTWHKDRDRCRKAGIPDDVVYWPKWQMALDQYRRAVANGVRFAWLTFDEGYGSKGPMVWQAKRLMVYLADERGLPTRPYHLLVARNALDHGEVKYFISNAPEQTSVETLLRVAFTRWVIERAFEDSKTELGMDHFEVRKFLSIQRHLILSCLRHIFLSEFCLKHRGEKPGPDGLPGPDRDSGAGAGVGSRWTLLAEVRRTDQRAIDVNTTAQRQGRLQPPPPNYRSFTRRRHQIEKHNQMSLETFVAL